MKVEITNLTPLAVIYGSGDLESGLARLLRKQHLRVLHLEKPEDALPILEKPVYVFFFANCDIQLDNLKIQFEEAIYSASRSGAKMVLILTNTSEAYEKALQEIQDNRNWPISLVETRGKWDGPSGSTTEMSAGKLIRIAFSSKNSTKQILIGKEITESKKPTSPQKILSTQDVFNKVNSLKKKTEIHPKKIIGRLALLFSASLLCLSLVMLGVPTLRALNNLRLSKDALTSGRFLEAQAQATKAQADFYATKQIALAFGPLSQNYFDLLILGETAADLMARTAKIAPRVTTLAKSLSLGESSNLVSLTGIIHEELKPIKIDLGLIEAQVNSLLTPRSKNLLAVLGLSVNKVNKYQKFIPEVRTAVNKVDNFLTVWPEISPPLGKKTYLLVFQNSAELRPTGGFIGSYGLVNFDNGKLVSWQIHDIYSADGQLKGQIAPPDELLHFFNQTAWYMRDANWSPDFPITAKRLLWFLEKETGQQADGVVAINLGAVQKLLKATGPLSLPDLSLTISSQDFFEKAEYSSEINFFAGSTQKKDFLGAVAKALIENITSNSNKNWPVISQALITALNEKDIMFYFTNPTIQKVAINSDWGGSLGDASNSLAVIDANLGLNKSNYFIKRGIGISHLINKDGTVEITTTVHYRNNSPSDTWPGGKYKNYIRFLVPQNSTIEGFDINDGRKPVLSSVLSAEQLAKIGTDQFFVFQTSETANFTSYGTLVEVPTLSDLIITFRYRLANKLVIAPKTTYNFTFLKQPGTGPDPLDVTINYPAFLVPEDAPIAFDQKALYNSNTATDQKFELKFVSKI